MCLFEKKDQTAGPTCMFLHNIGKVKGNTSHTVVLKDHFGPLVSQIDLSFQKPFQDL